MNDRIARCAIEPTERRRAAEVPSSLRQVTAAEVFDGREPVCEGHAIELAPAGFFGEGDEEWDVDIQCPLQPTHCTRLEEHVGARVVGLERRRSVAPSVKSTDPPQSPIDEDALDAIEFMSL